MDLKQSGHPSLIVNGHPMLTRMHSTAGDSHHHQSPFLPSTYARHPVIHPAHPAPHAQMQASSSLFHQDSALYQSVQGESDADSLAASKFQIQSTTHYLYVGEVYLKLLTLRFQAQ